MKKHFYVEIKVDGEVMTISDVADTLRDIAAQIDAGKHAGRITNDKNSLTIGLFELRRPTTEPAKW